MSEPRIRHLTVRGWDVQVNDDLGHMVVQIGAGISWSELWAIKNQVWGKEASAIEVYPPARFLVNNVPLRHLWRLGATDFWPDLQGRTDPADPLPDADSLAERYQTAWAEAWGT